MNLQVTQLSFFFDAIRALIKPTKVPCEPSIDHAEPRAIWLSLVQRYFEGRSDLMSYRIVWSSRPQKRVLASCNIEKKVVRIAPAMKLIESRPYLEALIYQLCHAVVGIGFKNGRRDIHSKTFKELESCHPEIKNLDLWIKQGGWIKAVRKSTRSINREKLSFRPF